MSKLLNLFEFTWQKFKAILSSKLGRLCVISSSFTLLAILLSVLLARVYIVPDVSYDVPFKGNASTTTINLETHYIDVDAITGTLTVDWYPGLDSCQHEPGEVVNIYFNRNLLNAPDPSKIASNNPHDEPIYKFNPGIECSGSTRAIHRVDMFRTVAKMVGVETNGKWTGPSLQWYPWDKYYAQFALFALLNSTNASVGMVTNPMGSPVNFNVKLDPKDSWNTDEGLYLVFDVTRSGVVKLLVMIIVVANWVATIAFLWITVASWLWRERVVKEMFVIPVATLFAFTSVRASMPGAPQGFGAIIDYVGILPNIASMAIFSATLLLVVLIRRTQSEMRETENTPVSQHLSPEQKEISPA